MHDPTAVVAGIVRELTTYANPERAAFEKRYLKSDLDHLERRWGRSGVLSDRPWP